MAVGFISIGTHPFLMHCTRVHLDGIDVTTRCYAANDVDGWVDCWKLNADGHKYLDDDGEAAQERLHGTVVIEFAGWSNNDCPYCGRIMSDREAREQRCCNACAGGRR